MPRVFIAAATLLFVFAAALAVQAAGEGHRGHGDHSDHVSEAGGLRIIHAWSRATGEREGFVFAEIENWSDHLIEFTGAESDMAGSARLVGFQNTDGKLTYVPIPSVPIAPGKRLMLEPNGLAIQLLDLKEPLEEGSEFIAHFELGKNEIEVHVEVEDEDATSHSHAGHNH
ncbi:MAG: copper chaperone PCu(A)C [Pseudomonadota bacterium]